MNISKFLRLPILKNIFERPIFDCFNGSLLHEPKVQGPDCMKTSGFRVRVTGLVFCF